MSSLQDRVKLALDQIKQIANDPLKTQAELLDAIRALDASHPLNAAATHIFYSGSLGRIDGVDVPAWKAVRVTVPVYESH